MDIVIFLCKVTAWQFHGSPAPCTAKYQCPISGSNSKVVSLKGDRAGRDIHAASEHCVHKTQPGNPGSNGLPERLAPRREDH